MNIREPLVELLVRYGTVLFPFRVESLVEAIPHLGFVVPEPIERQFGIRLGVSGAVGVKGDVKLQVSTDRQTVSVRGSDFGQVLLEFNAIEDLIQSRLSVASQAIATYYEIQLQAAVEAARKRPLAEMHRHFGAVPALTRFAAIIGRPVTNSGFRLVPPEVPATSPSWFDVRIEPEALQSDRVYLVHMVFRDTNRAEVFSLAERGSKLVEELVKAVEE